MSQRSQAGNSPYRYSEEMYKALFEQAADGIFIADEKGSYIEVNQRGCEMLGYTRNEILGRPMKDFVPIEDLTDETLKLKELESGSPLLKECRLRCKDGRLLPVEISARMLADGNFMGMVRDISERRRAEEQLHENNKRFRLLAESSLTGIYLIEDNLFRYVNPAFAHIFGYEVDEITDKLGPMNLVYADDRPLVAENVRRRVEGEEEAIQYDFRGLRKDGSMLYLEVHGRRIEYSGRMGVIGTLVDITERKKAEEALRTSEERLQLALDAARMGLWNWNISTGDVVWSQQCLALYGLPPNTQMSYERFLQTLHPEDRESVDAALRRAVDERTDYDEMKRTVWPDGSIHWTVSRGRVYYDAEGEPVRMTGVTFDITNWKEAQQELQRNREAALHFSEKLALLQEVTNQLSKAKSTDDLCRQAVQMGLSCLGFDRVSIWFIEEHQGCMRGSFGTDEDGQLRDERNAKIKFRHSGLAWRVFSQKEPNAMVEHQPLYNHAGEAVGEGDNAIAALWDGDEVIGVICVDNLFTQHPIRERQLEVLRLYATALGHLITRKRAEETLTLFSSLLDHANDTIELIDPETARFLDVNEQACLAHGYTREEYLSLTVPEISPVVTPQSWQETMAELQRSGSLISEGQHRRKDGSVFPVEINVNYIQLDRDYVLAVTRDITWRKEAEASLRQREAQLRHIIDTVPEGVILLEANGNISLTNPVAEQHLAVLMPDRENGRLTHLGNRPLSELLTSPPKGLWHEITSNPFTFEAIARPIENSSQNGGWVLVLRDITQERDIQSRVQRQERLAAVGQLAAGIAHDFNNILAVITLYAQLILSTVEVPKRTQEQLHTIVRQTDLAADLIQQILDFSRQSLLERRPLDLLSDMQELVKLLNRTLPEHIQVELTHHDEAYFIKADSSRIQQVMMNLAVNARDAMPDGGKLDIRLAHVQTEEPRPMSVQDLPPGNWIQIEVADNGGGIPQDKLPHVFEPFFTTKEIGQGTGLGLAQVYGIVEQHDGYIDVNTEIGLGTTFFLYFPALDLGINAVNSVDGTVLRSGNEQRVLVVEDDLATREALQDSLTRLNYKVLAATNGREALTILAAKANEIDLVLSDVVMPEMGGIALFYAMKQQGLAIPVLLLSGHPVSQEMEGLRTLGLAGWLPKPPDLVKLSYLLAETLAD